MRKKNLDLAEAMGEDIDVTEEQAIAANALVTKPAPVVPSAPLSMSMEDLQALVSSAVTAAVGASSASSAELADVVSRGIAQARQPIPEGTDHSNPNISAMNPLGERDHPKPLLKHKITLGIAEPKSGAIQRTYPFEQDDLTVYELIALNTLPESGEYTVHLYDGAPIKVRLVSERDVATDVVTRTTIVIPNHVTQKGSQIKNMLPGAVGLVAQITGRDFSKVSHDELAVLMAAHREKRYQAAA